MPLNQTEMFQFHNGTINTFSNHFAVQFFKEFQFHNGTINTRYFNISAKECICFNSTTVQLIHFKDDEISFSFRVSIPQRYN